MRFYYVIEFSTQEMTIEFWNTLKTLDTGVHVAII
jgi:hypothetical protein